MADYLEVTLSKVIASDMAAFAQVVASAVLPDGNCNVIREGEWSDVLVSLETGRTVVATPENPYPAFVESRLTACVEYRSLLPDEGGVVKLLQLALDVDEWSIDLGEVGSWWEWKM